MVCPDRRVIRANPENRVEAKHGDVTNVRVFDTRMPGRTGCGSAQGIQRVIHSKDLSGRGATRAKDAQGTPTQSHISHSMLVYEKTMPIATMPMEWNRIHDEYSMGFYM